jgi:alkyl hydroperoxide reductase subunit AhpC
MTIQLGDLAPDFTQTSSLGPIVFHAWLGTSWGVLFSHPKDFTPVCTTELAEAARLKPEFDRRNVKIIGISVDTLVSHAGWFDDIAQTQGQALNFPVLADGDRKVATLYGMIHPNSDPALTVRAVFIIAPDKKVRLILTYPPSTGRNFSEILRVIDSLQLTDEHKVATPVNWQDGNDVIIVPSLSDTEAHQRFPAGWRTLRPYLRLVKQPPLARHADPSWTAG